MNNEKKIIFGDGKNIWIYYKFAMAPTGNFSGNKKNG